MGVVDDVAATLADFVAGVDFEALDGAAAAHLVDVFTKVGRLAAAGRTAAAARVATTQAWKSSGARNAEEWLAQCTKTSRAKAASTLQAGEQLAGLALTEASFRAGRISEEQASEVASAAALDPASESRLVAEAEGGGLLATQRSALAVRAAACPDQLEARERVHRSRFYRHWRSADGAFEGRFRLTADHGALVAQAIDQQRRVVFAQARADGRHESNDAYQADALVELARNTLWPSDHLCAGDRPTTDVAIPADAAAGSKDATAGLRDAIAGLRDAENSSYAESSGDAEGEGNGDGDGHEEGEGSGAKRPDPGSPPPGTGHGLCQGCGCHLRPRSQPKALIKVRVDHEALLRGHTIAGETCEIEGIGPVPVETVRAAASDAILQALLIKKGRVALTAPAGRTIPAALRRLLEERDRTCSVPGCDNRHHLAIHHIELYSLDGPTNASNTCRVCSHHHDQITYQGALLSGSPGHRIWRPPHPLARRPSPHPYARKAPAPPAQPAPALPPRRVPASPMEAAPMVATSAGGDPPRIDQERSAAPSPRAPLATEELTLL